MTTLNVADKVTGVNVPLFNCVNRKQEIVVHFYVLSRLWVIDVFEIS